MWSVILGTREGIFNYGHSVETGWEGDGGSLDFCFCSFCRSDESRASTSQHPLCPAGCELAFWLGVSDSRVLTVAGRDRPWHTCTAWGLRVQEPRAVHEPSGPRGRACPGLCGRTATGATWLEKGGRGRVRLQTATGWAGVGRGVLCLCTQRGLFTAVHRYRLQLVFLGDFGVW